MDKKIWLSVHSRNFGSDNIARTHVLPPLHVSRCEMAHSLPRNPRHILSVFNLLLDIYVMINWQLSKKKKIQVSADRCHIEVMYFLKLSADQFLVSGPFLKGGIQFASCLWQNVGNLWKKFHKRSPRKLSFWPGLNLFTMWGIFVEKLSKGGFPLSRNVYVRTQVKFTGVNSTEDDYEYQI